jgi:hypothetical protein
MFSEVSLNPHVATGLCAVNPVSMAQLILPPEEELQPREDDPPTEVLHHTYTV